ncbi:MAG: capsular biosynthesis protein [Bacteroidetes bacterium]|nr:capsular biosynthesis protein [Bacteroidota bacterium]
MGLFNIFRKKPKRLSTPVDLSVLGTDIHSHFIPGIDDGAKTMNDSLQMIAEMQQLGYKKIITSPHTMSDYYRNTSEIILSGRDQVKQELTKAEINIEFDAVSEYYLDYDLEKKLDDGPLLTFGNKHLLFEISYMNPPDNLFHLIFKMQLQGYKPVLAHPERYNFWHKEFDKYEAFIDKGVLLQMNINSLTGYYSLGTKIVAEQMIDKNMISFVGTDCHHMGHINLLKQVVYEPHLEKLINSGTLLNKTL